MTLPPQPASHPPTSPIHGAPLGSSDIHVRAVVLDEIVCQGQCPFCGRWIDLTLQRSGNPDICPCGIEAVLVVNIPHLQRWYWRDPRDLPEGSGARRPPPLLRRSVGEGVGG